MSNDAGFKLGDTIKIGDVIGMKISEDGEWIKDVVEEVHPESFIIEVKLLEEFINRNVMVDDLVEFQLITGSIEYIVRGRVEDIGIVNPQRMLIEILSIEKYINSRRSKRYTVNLCGRITYNEGEKGSFVTVKNVSETGASIICKDAIPIDEEVDIDLVLWGKEVLSLEGKIVREYKVGKNHKYGIIIEYMTDRSRKLMKEFIAEMEKKEKEL